jgi:hypothetical protein
MEIAQVVVAFIFGVSFFITLLVVAVKFPNPTPFQYSVFRIILSLAAAGVAAMIPGFINLELKTGAELFIRAGGAIAVFVVIFFFNPAPLIVSKALESYQNEIRRQNNYIDKRAEQISLVVQKIRECDKAFNAMLTAFAKQHSVGPFSNMSNAIAEDDGYKENLKNSALESASDFGAKTSDLMATVNSSSFLIGPDLSSKAKEIAEAYLSIAYGIINNDKDGKASKFVENIDSMISAFESDAREYLV